MLGQRDINELESRQKLLDYAARQQDTNRDIDVLGLRGEVELGAREGKSAVLAWQAESSSAQKPAP